MKRVNPKRAGEELGVPTDLRKALAATPVAKTQWSDLTPIARRDFISWIDSAKQPETRRRRIERACSMLAAGKRRPCCYSIVSLDLHWPSRLLRRRRLSGAISRRSSAGALLAGWTQTNNRRDIEAGSRKPARCLRPESDVLKVFLYFSAAKQSKTRESRIKKCMEQILNGKG